MKSLPKVLFNIQGEKQVSDIIFKVYDGKYKTYKYRDLLMQEQFKFNKKSYGKSYWEKKVKNDEIGNNYIKLKEVEFKEKELKVLILLPENRRSNDYREVFFNKNKGFFNNHYFCAYCGFVYNKKSITVDHIFPIDKVSKNKIYKYFLNKINISNINDYRNLTPSCKSCNSKKGSKMGLWIVRGLLGKFSTTWALIWTMLIISIVFFIAKI